MKLTRHALPVLTSFFIATLLAAADAAKPAPAADGMASLLKATGLTQAQFLTGLKSGLGTAVDMAGSELAKPGALQLSVPSSMAKMEAAAQKLNQTGALDGFKASLNQAAMAVAPQATAAIKGAVGNLSLTDVTALSGGSPNAATMLLRKTAEPAIRTKLMPLVTQAIAANGTAAKAKDLAAKAGPLAAMMGVPGAADLESHVLAQLLDTSFVYLGKQEAALRANPASLKDALAKKVFGAGATAGAVKK